MTKEFKVFYDGEPATKEQLDAIEEIVVEQQVDVQWTARIKIPVCIKEDGSWDAETDAAYQEFARVRIEARIGDGDFIPLIDGTIQSQEPDLNSSPGLSAITLVVHDDTNLLHREAAAAPHTAESDSDIVRSMLETAALGEDPDIDDIPSRPDTNAVVNQHGTVMEMLRSIASRYGNFHAYVLPGAEAGTSKGCFKKFPTEPDQALPPMFLSGPEQNITGFRIQRNSGRAARVEGSHLSMSDKSVATVTAGPGDTPPASGETATAGTETDTRLRRLPPGIGDHTDMTEAANGMADQSSYTLRADGNVIPACYSAILSPYKMVSVRVSNSRFSSGYVIYKVVHTLGISEYTQSFSVVGNAASPEALPTAGLPSPSAAVGGAFSVSFNIQVDIF